MNFGTGFAINILNLHIHLQNICWHPHFPVQPYHLLPHPPPIINHHPNNLILSKSTLVHMIISPPFPPTPMPTTPSLLPPGPSLSSDWKQRSCISFVTLFKRTYYLSTKPLCCSVVKKSYFIPLFIFFSPQVVPLL